MKKLLSVLLLLIAIGTNVCDAQSAAEELFTLKVYSNIESDDEEIKPTDTYDIVFKKQVGKLIIECKDVPQLNMTLSGNLTLRVDDEDGYMYYYLLDEESVRNDEYTNGIIYIKKKNCSIDNRTAVLFSILNNGRWYEMVNAMINFYLPGNKFDQNLSFVTIQEDKLIEFMKSYAK